MIVLQTIAVTRDGRNSPGTAKGRVLPDAASRRPEAADRYLIAMAFAGDPTPPTTFSGLAEKKNS